MYDSEIVDEYGRRVVTAVRPVAEGWQCIIDRYPTDGGSPQSWSGVGESEDAAVAEARRKFAASDKGVR